MSENPITVGGAYKESDSHVPNPTDMVAQFNTEGVGAHGKIEEVSPIFEVDKVKTAQEIVGALDPDNKAVSSDRVLLPTTAEGDPEAAKESLLKVAEARAKEGVEIGGPTPAEREAALEGTEGEEAAVESERSNAASNSTGSRDAGQHTDAAGQPVSGSDEGENKAAKKAAAKKTTSSNS